MESSDPAVLILAAGRSSRLGTPKQLLTYRGNTLLGHAASHALKFSSEVHVVLGHAHEACESAIAEMPVTIGVNPRYHEGIGNSIAYGISQIKSKFLLIMLCDQPLIPTKHYLQLIGESKANPHSIIASEYDSKPGVPALFPFEYFPSLQKLSGDKGAKPLLISNPCIHVPIHDSCMSDIDTWEDWHHFLQQNES